MKFIYTIILVLSFSLCAFSQSSEINNYYEGRGNVEYQDLMQDLSVGDDSTTVVAGDTIWSSIAFIGNCVGTGGGHGVIQYVVYSPANDSVCYRGDQYQLAVKTWQTYHWTTYGTLSDTLYTENTLRTIEVDFDTLGAFLWFRAGVVASNNADTTYWQEDQVCNMWCSFPVNSAYHKYDYDPTDIQRHNDESRKDRRIDTENQDY